MCSDAPLLSLIIPAYNAAATLPRALQSVLNQGFDDLEVIVVDDGSSDDTETVVERYAYNFGSKLNFVSLSENLGSAKAYSRGLNLARGRFVGRLDADDEIPAGAFAAMAETARSSECAIVWGGIVSGNRYAAPPKSTDLNSCSIDVEHFSLCNKWIKRELAAKFPPLFDCWDDLSSFARILATNPAVTTLNRPVYNYILKPRGQSLSTAAQQRVLDDHIATATALDRWFADNRLDSESNIFLLHLKFAAKVKLLRCKPRRPDVWKEIFPEVNGQIMTLRHVPLRYRLLFAAVNAMPVSLSKPLLNLF